MSYSQDIEEFSKEKPKPKGSARLKTLIKESISQWELYHFRLITLIKVLLQSSRPDHSQKEALSRILSQVEQTIKVEHKLSWNIINSFNTLKQKVIDWMEEPIRRKPTHLALQPGLFIMSASSIENTYSSTNGIIESGFITPPHSSRRTTINHQCFKFRPKQRLEWKDEPVFPPTPKKIYIPAAVVANRALTQCEGKCLACERTPGFSIHANGSHLLCDRCWEEWYQLCDRRLKCCVNICRYPQMAKIT